jgi:hypothetical protein
LNIPEIDDYDFFGRGVEHGARAWSPSSIFDDPQSIVQDGPAS